MPRLYFKQKVTVTEDHLHVRGRDEYIFFLKLNPDTQHYYVVAGAQGVFKNVGGEVEQVGKMGSFRKRGHIPILLFIQELTDAMNPGQGRGNNK